MNIPESARLGVLHHIDNDMIEAKKSFWELAKSRITYRSQAEHLAYQKLIFGEDYNNVNTAVYVCAPVAYQEGDSVEKWVAGLEISINKDIFGDDYQDLIPYAVEHEIFEAWLSCKRGLQPKTLQEKHLLARRRQLEMAMADDNADRLLDFYKALDPGLSPELDYAYSVAERKALAREKSQSAAKEPTENS